MAQHLSVGCQQREALVEDVRSPQNCRTARSQPIAAKHLFCTMAGFVDAPA